MSLSKATMPGKERSKVNFKSEHRFGFGVPRWSQYKMRAIRLTFSKSWNKEVQETTGIILKSFSRKNVELITQSSHDATRTLHFCKHVQILLLVLALSMEHMLLRCKQGLNRFAAVINLVVTYLLIVSVNTSLKSCLPTIYLNVL